MKLSSLKTAAMANQQKVKIISIRLTDRLMQRQSKTSMSMVKLVIPMYKWVPLQINSTKFKIEQHSIQTYDTMVQRVKLKNSFNNFGAWWIRYFSSCSLLRNFKVYQLIISKSIYLLNIMLLARLSRPLLANFSTFQSKIGQAGKLTFALAAAHTHLTIHTIWEDCCRFTADDLEQSYQISELENDEILITSTDEKQPSTLLAEIPEYFSYRGLVSGDIRHCNSAVDAKLCGDLDIRAQGNFEAQKIKSERCRIVTNRLKIHSYIESQYCQLEAEEIDIRKLLISQSGNLRQQNGIITIRSIYTQPGPLVVVPANQLDSYIDAGCHVRLYSHASKAIKIGQVSGIFHTETTRANTLHIRQLSGTFKISHDGEAKTKLIANSQGLIRAGKLDLEVYDQLKVNIYLNGKIQNELWPDGPSVYIEADELQLTFVNNIFGM